MITFEELAKEFAVRAAKEYGIYDVEYWFERYMMKWFETQHAIMKYMDLKEEHIDNIAEFLNKVVGTMCLEEAGVQVRENELANLSTAVNKNYKKLVNVEKLISDLHSHLDAATEKIINVLDEKSAYNDSKIDKLIEMIDKHNYQYEEMKSIVEKEISLLKDNLVEYDKRLEETKLLLEESKKHLEEVNNAKFGTRLKFLFGKVKF